MTIAANEYGTDYIADVIFNVPDDAKEKSKLNASGSRIEITGKINSISSDTGSLQAMIYTQDDSWNWNQMEKAASIKAGQEFSLSYDLTQMSWKGSTLEKIGLRFVDNAVNTSKVSYTLDSAKLIVGDSSSGGGTTGGSAGGTTEDGLDANAREDSSLYSASYTAKPGNQYWTEYTFSITNHTSQAVSKVQAVMKTSGEPKGFKSFESINAVYNATVGGVIVYYAGEIAAGATVNINGKIGFDPTSVTVSSAYVRAVNCNPPSGETTESGKLNYKLTGTTKDIPFSQTPVGKHGKLHLKKVAGYGNAPVIVDKNDNPYQLRGASSHGIQWEVGYNYVNKGAMQSLRDEWGVNLFRMACYVTQDGYTVGAQSRMDQKIEEGVQAAKELGMYVIVDWHIHAENPHTTKSWAKDFFKKYATKYKDYDNVIFEICNEPTNVQWYTGGGNDLYSYCKEIAGIIRDCGSDALIVCGTNTWSQDVEDVAKKPLKDDGFEDILYTFHFYSGSHYADKMAKVKTATADGTPIFVTEFGICDASGNGGFDTANADAWIKLCDSYNISYACWSFCNKGESASYLSTSCSKTTGGYVASDLATTGIWLVNTYRAHQDIEEGIDTKVTPKPSTSASAKPGTSSSEKPSTSASAKPGTSSSEKPSTSASAKPGTSSSEKPSTSASAKPGTSSSEKPSTSASAKPGTSSSEKPSTSASAKPGTSSSEKPSTSASTKPGTSSSEKPSTSASAKPGTSSSEKPSTSASAKPGTSSSEKPSTSASAKPGTDPGSNPEVSSNPATDKTPVPGESQKPGESAGPAPGSSEAPVPGESVGPVPGSSGTPVPDTSSKPGTSPTPTKSQDGSTTSGGGKTTTAPSGSMAQSPSTEDEDLTEDGEKITLRLAKKTLTIKRGKKKRIVIKVKASGDKVKRYKVIGRKKIVRVNAKGVVAAKKKGKVTIKVIMKSGATAKCKIIVKK